MSGDWGSSAPAGAKANVFVLSTPQNLQAAMLPNIQQKHVLIAGGNLWGIRSSRSFSVSLVLREVCALVICK